MGGNVAFEHQPPRRQEDARDGVDTRKKDNRQLDRGPTLRGLRDTRRTAG